MQRVAHPGISIRDPFHVAKKELLFLKNLDVCKVKRANRQYFSVCRAFGGFAVLVMLQ